VEIIQPCSFCGNRETDLFDTRKGVRYCRVCLPFQTEPIAMQAQPFSIEHILQLGYALTPAQERVSEGILSAIQQQKDVMVDAVTGSGKTEIVFASILWTLKQGGRVGFVIPRRDVVRELFPRLVNAFPFSTCVEVYGGHTDQLEGHITVLTTHQLYRYQHYFSLLVFDELDAFPYVGNRVLKAMVKRSVKGSIIYLSATFTPYVLKAFHDIGGHIERLEIRHHQHPMPQLKWIRTWQFLSYFLMINRVKIWVQNHKPVIIFVPTLAEGKRLFQWLSLWIPKGRWVHAGTPTRDEDIEAFKQGKVHYLVSTSILERGITLVHLQVIIASADHPLMEEKTLIQMAGRVGRKKEDPYGEVILYAQVVTPAMVASYQRIEHANRALSTLF